MLCIDFDIITRGLFLVKEIIPCVIVNIKRLSKCMSVMFYYYSIVIASSYCQACVCYNRAIPRPYKYTPDVQLVVCCAHAHLQIIQTTEPMRYRWAETFHPFWMRFVSNWRRELLCGTWPRDQPHALACGFSGRLATRLP